MQPASGARDLNPQQVEVNHLISNKLSNVYKIWGYEEVSPPNIERQATLMAGGAISNKEILKIVSNESLGLRPEMTASISRTASTRLINKPRPLRLWAKGTVFKSKEDTSGATNIEENQQSGIELFGVKSISAEIELLAILLDCLKSLDLSAELKPKLLIGHTQLMDLILSRFDLEVKDRIKTILINYDLIGINNLNLEKGLKDELISINMCRGMPVDVLKKLESMYGNVNIIDELMKLFKIIMPIYNNEKVKLQLDPTFTPHYELYNGFVFQLICNTSNNQVVIARGGRYDGIVSIFSLDNNNAAGVGFSFAVDKIRELFNEYSRNIILEEKFLIAYSKSNSIQNALKKQREFHQNGKIAVIELEPCKDKNIALSLLLKRNFTKLVWLD